VPVVIPPFGVHPIGHFVPGDPTRRLGPAGILADKIDPNTNDFLSIVVGDDPIDAQVSVAFRTERRSGAAVMDTGQRFLDIRKLTDDADELIMGEAREALRLLLQREDIELESAAVVRGADAGTGADWAELTVAYINRRSQDRTREEQTFRLPGQKGIQ
jgi:hypothetical protein